MKEKLMEIIRKSDEIYGAGYTKGTQTGYQEGQKQGYTQGHEEGVTEGKASEHRSFWSQNQRSGTRKNYESAYLGWGYTSTNFVPLYDIRPTESCARMFALWNLDTRHRMDFRQRLLDCHVTLDTSMATDMTQCFYSNYFTSIPAVTVPGGIPTEKLFADCKYLSRIDMITVEEDTIFEDWFEKDKSLQNIRFSGVIGKNGLDFRDCTRLTLESLQSIIACLKDYGGGGTHTIVFGSTNLAKLTREDLNAIAAKGWTVT